MKLSRRCITSRSIVISSRPRWARFRMVPPGVSYTPRDFMPTRRFSTKSAQPTPLRPAISFAFVSKSTASSFSPLMATGTPFSKSTVTYSG